MEKAQFKRLRIDDNNKEDVLFINTWANAPIIKHVDFDLQDTISN